MGYRTEGRVATYKLAKRAKVAPWVDIELRIIAVSAINERVSKEFVLSYHIEGNLDTTEIIVKPIVNGGE